MLLDAGAGGDGSSSGRSDPSSREGAAGGSSRSSSSSQSGQRHVRFDEGANLEGVSSIHGESTMRLSRVGPRGQRMTAQSNAPGEAGARVLNERDIKTLGAPPGGWDTDIKKVKDTRIDWKHGEQITQDLWESLSPKVAGTFTNNWETISMHC